MSATIPKPFYTVNLIVETGQAKAVLAQVQRERRPAITKMVTDPYVLFTLLLSLLLAASLLYMDHKASMLYRSLIVDVKKEIYDSTSLGEQILAADRLRRTRARVTHHIDIIRTLDEDRYVWAHLLDQIALAVPSDLWIESITEASADPKGKNKPETSTGSTKFQVQGLASSNEKVSEFIRGMEASSFIAGVSFASSKVVQISGQSAIRFVLRGESEKPDRTLLELIPIDGTAGTASTVPANGQPSPPGASAPGTVPAASPKDTSAKKAPPPLPQPPRP